jgi:predicted kinase
MQKIKILKGYPASGKSTFARKAVEKSGGQLKRWNNDDVRALMDNGTYSWENEKFLLHMRDEFIDNCLRKGYDVVIDNTNLHPKHERTIREKFGHRATIEVLHFDVDAEECIRRDALREGTARVGEEVIRKMERDWAKWKNTDTMPKQNMYNPIIRGDDLPDAVCVDIDGTIATNTSGRGFFEWDAVDKDDPIVPVINMLNHLPMKKIIVTGRDEVCRQKTEFWLQAFGVEYEMLLMRPLNDNREDTIVKAELFDKHINGKYNVDFVIDDRLIVCRMWVDRGLFVFNVNQYLEWF